MLSGSGGQVEPSPYESEADEARDHREVESGLLRWTDENDAKIQSRQKKIFSQDIL